MIDDKKKRILSSLLIALAALLAFSIASSVSDVFAIR
jgi:hypothetical protein